jgi:putative hydrolase of the HAD superfamily
MVQAVFFDFGETLAALSPAKEELFKEAASLLGLTLDIEVVRRAYQIVDFNHKYSSVTVSDRDSFYQQYNERLAEALGISSSFSELQPLLAAEFRKRKFWQLFDDVGEVLDRLRERDLPIALVANWDADLPQLLERLEIREAFAAVVSSQAAGVEKPDPAIFKLALAQLGLTPPSHRVLYVGNEYRADVLGARAAGLIPVLIDRHGLYRHADCLRFPSLRQWCHAMS